MALLTAAWYALMPLAHDRRVKLPRMLGGIARCASVTLLAINLAYALRRDVPFRVVLHV